MASGRSLVQEVEFRLERSFQQQQIAEELEGKLKAQADGLFEGWRKEQQQWRDKVKEELGITKEALAQRATEPKPSLLDLAPFAESPEDTSKQTTTEKKEDPK